MNTPLVYLSMIVLAYVGMEFMAWFTHKYVMHGFLWKWHEDHHLPRHEKEGFFEKNDRFFLVFAVPSAFCYMFGSMTPHFWVLFIGVGISLYGLTYFLIHDVYIHRRFKWFKQLDSRYSRAILRAHGSHHARREREAGESFGLLLVHPKYFKSKATRKEDDLLIKNNEIISSKDSE